MHNSLNIEGRAFLNGCVAIFMTETNERSAVMKIDNVLWPDIATMSLEDLNREIHIIRREMLERSVEAAITAMNGIKGHSVSVAWLALETALSTLDADDGCPDYEEGGDFEEGGDLEDENEHGTDLDRGEDELDEGNLEPFLGWPEECSQYASLAALGINQMAAEDPNDIDALPLAGEPLDFKGDGRQAARELIRKARAKAGYWMRRRALRLQ
jgi:hypothetical protein